MLSDLFHRIARRVAHAIGTPVAFVIALTVCVAWAASGPLCIGLPTGSVVAPPDASFCYHPATTLPRTRMHEAKVWSVGILGFLRG